MAYTWTDELITGDEKIDSQHKKLFECVNDFLEACSQGKGKEEVENTATFLYDYTVSHFKDEEDIQLKYDYPEYRNHKELHDAFKIQAIKLVNDILVNGTTSLMLSKVNVLIGGWIVKHIKNEDIKMVIYIKNIKNINNKEHE